MATTVDGTSPAVRGRLEGRVAIVTGGAKGIGLHYVRALAGAGARVAMLDVADGAQAAAGIEGDVRWFGFDVRDESRVSEVVADVVDWAGPIDILVNNAAAFATLDHVDYSRITTDLWDLVMQVNVRGPWLMAKHVGPMMAERGSGKIVNISSGVAFKGLARMAHYATSKAAVLGLTRTLALELGPRGVNVNTLAPGLIRSESVDGDGELFGANAERVMASRSIKREGFPRDLVGALLFLVSDDSDFVSGQTLVVDGGSVTL